MDKGTMLTIADYCFEKAKAAKEKQDKLYNEFQYYQYDDKDAIELIANFYKETGRFNAFMELYDKLKEL